MRRAPAFRVAAALLLVGTVGGCALVSDLDHEVGGGGATAGPGSSSGGSEGGAGPSASTSTSATTGGNGSTGPSTSSATTGVGGAPGGGGGGGGEACSFDGAGPGQGPWSLTLGPLPKNGLGPPLDLEMDGERVVLGLAAAKGAGEPTPLLLDGQAVTPGTEARYVVGWVDDGGASRAWPLASASPITLFPTIDVEPVGDGRALIALSGASGGTPGIGRALVHSVDLCEGTEGPPILDCAQGVSGAAIDVADDGRMAIALTVGPGTVCSVLPGDCLLPGGIGTQDTVLLHVDPGGSCATTLVREDDEGQGYTYSSQNAAVPALADDGSVVVVGTYDGDLFDGAAAIDTGAPHYLEGDRPGSFDSFHRYLARFEPDGGTLRVDDAVDLGIIAFGVGWHGVVWRDGAAVVVTGANIAVQPTGPFDPPTSVTGGVGYIDVLAGVFPTPAAPTALRWYGGGSVEVPWRLSSTDAGMMMAGWSTSVDAATVGSCGDPVVVEGGSLQGGGCAFFVGLEEDAGLGAPFVVGAVETGALDVGYGAYALPGGESIVVGVTTGTVQLDRTLAPPPAGFVQLYVARR